MVHAGGIRSWGTALPWAWPRDGRRETLEGAGIALAKHYGAQGLNMLYQHAQFEDGYCSHLPIAAVEGASIHDLRVAEPNDRLVLV